MEGRLMVPIAMVCISLEERYRLGCGEESKCRAILVILKNRHGLITSDLVDILITGAMDQPCHDVVVSVVGLQPEVLPLSAAEVGWCYGTEDAGDEGAEVVVVKDEAVLDVAG